MSEFMCALSQCCDCTRIEVEHAITPTQTFICLIAHWTVLLTILPALYTSLNLICCIRFRRYFDFVLILIFKFHWNITCTNACVIKRTLYLCLRSTKANQCATRTYTSTSIKHKIISFWRHTLFYSSFLFTNEIANAINWRNQIEDVNINNISHQIDTCKIVPNVSNMRDSLISPIFDGAKV